MKNLFKWLKYGAATLIAMIMLVFVLAYWNRDRIFHEIKNQLSKGINGELHIAKIDFTILHNLPNFSISLKDVSLRDTVYNHELFTAQKIFLDVKLYELFKKEIHIRALALEEASIFLYRSKNGYINTEIFKTPTDSTTREKETSYLLSLPRFEFRNVSFSYVDSVQDKGFKFHLLKTRHLISRDSGVYNIKINGAMHFDELTFNPSTGGFLINTRVNADLHFSVDALNETLTLHPSSLSSNKATIGMEAIFDLHKNGNYNLNLRAENLNLEGGKTLVNTKIASRLDRFTLDKPVNLTVSLSGKNSPGYQPNIEVRFQTNDCRLTYGKMDFSDLSFVGIFTQPSDTTPGRTVLQSKVEITSFKGKVENLPCEGTVAFTRLDDPHMILTMKSEIDFKTLNTMVDTSQVATRSGNFFTEISYEGKLDEYLDPTRTKYEGKLNGKIKATNATVFYKPKKLLLEKINAAFEFNEKQFIVNDLSLNVNKSPLNIKGSVRNFIPFFIRPKDKGYVKLTISSPHFDLTSLSVKKTGQKKSDQQMVQQRKKISELIDLAYQKLDFDLRVKADKLNFRKFNAHNVTGQVKLSNNSLHGNAITLKVADGTMDLNFTLRDIHKEQSELDVITKVTDADINAFFLSFNDFNQKTVQAHNLSGNVSAHAKFHASVTDDYKVLAPSMRGNVDCTIKHGRLKDFEPLLNVSTFLFRKRDFSDVQFAELNSRFEIEGTALNISRMEIQSTVLTMFLHGRYSFTDSTSLSLQLPLSNLKKRDKSYKPENIGVDAKAGPSVFLHLFRNRDINSKMNIAYDPFKKWAKK